MRATSISFLMPSNKYAYMRIVEDRYGNRFLEIENKEDFRKFKEDLLKIAVIQKYMS
jgi:hypothetical protein